MLREKYWLQSFNRAVLAKAAVVFIDRHDANVYLYLTKDKERCLYTRRAIFQRHSQADSIMAHWLASIRRDYRIMSNQEHNEYRSEQARALDKFHDRFAYQQTPEWLRDEAKAPEQDDIYNLGYHTAELNKLGTLVLSEPGTRMALSAEEAYKLLTWLNDNHRDTLYKLTHQSQNQER